MNTMLRSFLLLVFGAAALTGVAHAQVPHRDDRFHGEGPRRFPLPPREPGRSLPAGKPGHLEVFDAFNANIDDLGVVGRDLYRTYRKSDSGLTCDKYLAWDRRSTSSRCRLNSRPDAFRIYRMLDAREVNVSRDGRGGYLVSRRQVGALTCDIARPLHRGLQPKAKCSLRN